MGEQPILIYMPIPPSLNKLWSTVPGKKRVRSQEYRAWIAIAGWEVKRQIVGMKRISCRFNMEIHVPISKRDTGNWEKAIGDILQTIGVVTNDGNLHELTVRPMGRTDCMVVLTPLPEMGGVRTPAKMPWQSSGPTKSKPSQARIRKAEALRSGQVRF